MQDEAGRSEAQRIRNEARAAVKRWAASALPYAHAARIERAVAGAPRARRAAIAALRAALADPALAPHRRLYVARYSRGAASLGAGGHYTREVVTIMLFNKPL